MGKRVLFGKLRVYIGHRCCATIAVWLFLIFVAHYKIVRRERSISGLRAGIKIPVGLRNAPAGAAPYGYFVGWQHVIKCSVGNGLDRSRKHAVLPIK